MCIPIHDDGSIGRGGTNDDSNHGNINDNNDRTTTRRGRVVAVLQVSNKKGSQQTHNNVTSSNATSTLTKASFQHMDQRKDGKYLSEGASIANGSTVVDIFITPPSFKCFFQV
mgnify:CR=1 FL=1